MIPAVPIAVVSALTATISALIATVSVWTAAAGVAAVDVAECAALNAVARNAGRNEQGGGTLATDA